MLVCAAAVLVVVAMRNTANLFYTPERLAEFGLPEVGQQVKIGGFVEPGSMAFAANAQILFTVIDNSQNTVPVSYTGITPDLFREGSGVVATGSFDDSGQFVATELLAKHDENYVPRELQHMEMPSS